MQRLMAALQTVGPKVADAVEKYAPKFVKDAAVDAAKWTAESPTAKNIGDTTGKVLDKVKEKTGVDVGGGTESVVRDLVDPGGETSNEATARRKKENEAFNASTADFEAVMAASGLQTDLFHFRSAAEYNAIVDVWQAESEPSILNAGKPRGKWRPMVEALVANARQRKADKEAGEAAKKAADKAAKKRDEDKAAAELAALVKTSLAEMEAARKGAQGSGNDLNNGEKKTPNPKARKYFENGWPMWTAGEGARKQAGGLQGMDQVHKAKEATAQYVKAKTVFTAGLAQMH